MRPEIYEKDIDALLERRFKSDALFTKNFIDAVSQKSGIRINFDTMIVTRQVRHAGVSGTIDVLCQLLQREREVARLLLEDKLDSSFTPEQPERYASSAFAMTRAGCPAIPTICAPAEYLRGSKYIGPFRASISYEHIREWVDGEDRDLIDKAILRFEMPYEPDPVPEVADFHEGYRKMVGDLAPELHVKSNPNSGGARPAASRTMYFDTKKSLPRYGFLPALRFSHQCWDSGAPSASVKVMFAGWARYAAHLQVHAKELLGTKLHLRPAGQSLALVLDTPRLDNMKPASVQRDKVIAGIRAAANLRAWMFSNEQKLREWAKAIEAATR